jgi:hypothetical protein
MNMLRLNSTIGALLLMSSFAFAAQHESRIEAAFKQLQVPATTDQAAKDLLALSKANPAARKYLVEHLPTMIERDPKTVGDSWLNAVRLAGELKLSETAPALVKWINFQTGGMVGMAIWERLDNYPAGKALSQIGDPAVPTLEGVLQNGTEEERSVAIRALSLIHSSAAKAALEAQLDQQKPKTKEFIKSALDHWNPS